MDENPYVTPCAGADHATRALAGPVRRFVGLLIYVATIFPAAALVAGVGGIDSIDLATVSAFALSIAALVWLGRRVRADRACPMTAPRRRFRFTLRDLATAVFFLAIALVCARIAAKDGYYNVLASSTNRWACIVGGAAAGNAIATFVGNRLAWSLVGMCVWAMTLAFLLMGTHHNDF